MIVIALFGVGGAAVASGQMDGLIGYTAQPAAAPSQSAIATPTSTPTPTPTPTATHTPTPAPTAISPADSLCATEVTMSIWAHYDDDLIFGNPGLQDAMDAGDCIRTVFLTASDGGRGTDYSRRRELGILRAYNTMRGQQGLWSEHRVTLLSGAVLSQWSPDGDPDITIAFLRLPDGGLQGEGFPTTGRGSLLQLLNDQIPALPPVDGARELSSEALVASLAETIQAYHPTRLVTHIPSGALDWAVGDHSDHAVTGTFVRAAWQHAGLPAAQVMYAIGYPSKTLPVNVSDDALARKLAAYRVYAAEDPVVACATDAACLAQRLFGQSLPRHYLRTDAELFPAG